MIHVAVPVLLAAALAGCGVYAMLARRHAVLVLIGAELLLAAAGVLLITAATLPASGLAGLVTDGAPAETVAAAGGTAAGDRLLGGQVATIMLITVAAAEVGLALAIVLALFRARATVDLAAITRSEPAGPAPADDQQGAR